jgi:ABC-2 type transport system ATP-binding protein
MTAFIHAEQLNKSFGANRAVNNLSLTVEPGEIYGLVGADGAGKTTTIRLICGALLPDSGEITVCSYDVKKQTEQARQHLGYLSQRFSMYEDLTVLENIRFFAEVRGLKANEWYPRSMEILDFVGLAAFKDRFAGMLSGGMKQKLGLASALVSSPQVLLLDEPTTGVDPVTRQDFWQLIIKLVSSPQNGDRVSVLISTPYMDEAARCHRIGFMKKGQLIAEGTPGQLRSMLDGQILELRGGPLAEIRHRAAEVEGVENVQAFGDRLHLRVGKGQAEGVMKRLPKQVQEKGGSIESLRALPPTLEDVFIALSHDDA